VLLQVRVLADGTVASVAVAASSGHEVLDEAALEAVRAWHFVPAKQAGRAVESTVNVPINFNLLDAQ
jgi:protein TonB